MDNRAAIVLISMAFMVGAIGVNLVTAITPEVTGAARPLEVIGPPYDGQYRETSAQIPPYQLMDWWGRVDGGFITWEGRYALCFDFIIYGAGPNGEDLITSSPCPPCPEYLATPYPTGVPTPTYTPSSTPRPTPTRTPTRIIQ